MINKIARSVIVNLTFASLQKQILIHLIYFVEMYLNDFLSIQGISEKHSPRDIVTVLLVGFNKNRKAVFGSHF